MKKTLSPECRIGNETPHASDYTIFDRTQHQPPRGVIATLDDLAGWTAETEGLNAAFGTTPAYALWGPVGTFVEIAPVEKGHHQAGTVTLRPPTPLSILPDADFFELWICGDAFDWQQLNANFSLTLLARTPGAATEEALIIAPCINWPTFTLCMIKIPTALRGGVGVVTGLRIQGAATETRRRIGLDRLCTCRDERPPLILAPRPRRPITLPAGQTRGLHTGPGTLPFPTREETILPDNLTDNFTTDITQQDDSVLFRYCGEDAEITYTWTPAVDPLRVTLQVNGHDFGQAFAGATWGGDKSIDWVAKAWRGNRYADEDPLSSDQLLKTPGDTLNWRHTRIPHCAGSDTAGDTLAFPPYDIERHGGSPIYHLYREIEADEEQEIRLSASAPREHTACWLNGERIDAEREGQQPERVPWNSYWPLKLHRGRNLICIRFILWDGGSCEFKPLSDNTRWLGSWKVFGPTPYNPGAEAPQPIGATDLDALTVTNDAAMAKFMDPHFGALTLSLQIMGKSLVVDLQNTSGRLAYFLPGRFVNLHHARARKAPAMGNNAILISDTTAGTTCFCSLFHDWYRSNASSWRGQTACTESRAALQGPLLYLPKTDGIRNGFFERYFLTCSLLYEEALPNIPNPASPWAKEAGRYVFQESWGPDTFEKELAKANHWAAFGMTDILHLHHELGWSHNEAATPKRDNRRYWVNDGCTLRLDIAPGKGGTEGMQRFLAAEKALGLRAGLYTNYTDYYTLNSRFRSDLPILLSDGSRQTAWVHSYAMKPALAVEFDAWFAPRIAERFRPPRAYTSVHTCIPPWHRVDFDARVPGAGTFAATYYAFGELLLNDQRHYAGPVFSEGGYHHWIYAGLVSGNYGQVIITADDPPNPTFNLLKVHPLETDVGLSVGTNGWIKGTANLDAQVDRYLLACLTYGHIAYLPEEPFDTRLLLRVYHLARAASHHTAGERPLSIHYADARGRWMSVSEAQTGGLDDHCRLRIIYPGAKILYANWSRTQSWTLPNEGTGIVVLPPNGFRFASPYGLICASDEVADRRCDRAETPGAWYLDGRGQKITWGPLTASGSVAIITDPAQTTPWKLIDGGGNTTIRLAAADAPERLRALAEDGRILAEFAPVRDGDVVCITPVDGAVRYERA